MHNRFTIVKGAALAAMILAGSTAAAGGAPPESTGIAPAPDSLTVLRTALNRALADGSNAALILFIARNPDEPATDQARAALAARHDPDPRPFPGPDGDIIGAFDRARLAGPEALAAFAATFAGHPLAAEANRPSWH